MLALSALPVGSPRAVARVSLDPDGAAWLAAVGIGVGDEVVILRRGALGGPLHVRTHTGAEFALALELAGAIFVGEPSALGESAEPA